MVGDRNILGEKIEAWLHSHPAIEPVDSIVTQSSDSAFHCVAITIFYWENISG